MKPGKLTPAGLLDKDGNDLSRQVLSNTRLGQVLMHMGMEQCLLTIPHF